MEDDAQVNVGQHVDLSIGQPLSPIAKLQRQLGNNVEHHSRPELICASIPDSVPKAHVQTHGMSGPLDQCSRTWQEVSLLLNSSHGLACWNVGFMVFGVQRDIVRLVNTFVLHTVTTPWLLIRHA